MERADFVLGDPDRAACVERVRGGALSFATRAGMRTTSRLLIEALPKARPEGGALLCGFASAPAVALAASRIWPGAAPPIVHFEIDAFAAERARATLERNGARGIEVIAAADLPGIAWQEARGDARFGGAPFGAIALPFPRGGDALLAREIVEESSAALVEGGALWAATDNRDPSWLESLLEDVFDAVDAVRREPDVGAVFRARRGARAARVKDRRRTFELPAGERALAITTRPGVFSQGRLDGGSAALLDSHAFETALAGARSVLDIGCGAGALGLVAAARSGAERCLLVDASVRAVDLARTNAAANGIAGATAVVSPDAALVPDDAFDLAVANPPYFADFRIAAHFIATAHRALIPGGRFGMVAKERERHGALIESAFGGFTVEDVGGYGVFSAKR